MSSCVHKLNISLHQEAIKHGRGFCNLLWQKARIVFTTVACRLGWFHTEVNLDVSQQIYNMKPPEVKPEMMFYEFLS